MNPENAKFKVGDKFVTRGKVKKLCTITDILKTYNSKNELVEIRYVAVHYFMGQAITDCNVPEITILMSHDSVEKVEGI
jgi:hypothetical protein